MKLNYTLLTGLTLLLAAPLAAEIYRVNSAEEHGDGICDAIECTIDEAVEAALANPGEDHIDASLLSGDPEDVYSESEIDDIPSS